MNSPPDLGWLVQWLALALTVWQVENISHQRRWWFPCGTDLAIGDPDHAAHIINGQRRH